ncbi:MAG: FkbM family methyltransferase [Cyanobacteriota bacterium]|nr:FkbM family methyltransferase [Cyanobacteriota bacterium]
MRLMRPADIAKRFYRFFAKPRAGYILAEILASMSQAKPVHVLQLGANDGVLFDPIHNSLMRRPNITATRIEPVTEYFDELRENCSSFASRVELFNVCIGKEDGFVDLFLPRKRGSLHPGDKGHGSINPEAAGRSRDGLESRKVPCKSFQSLMKEMGRPFADVYVSDCEGYDIELLQLLPIKDLGIKVVFIELLQNSLSGKREVTLALKDAVDIVASNGFNRIIWDGNDFLSWQSPIHSTSQNVLVEGFVDP